MNVKIFKRLKEWRGSLVYAYLFAMFSIFLFFFRNYYFDITPAKYFFFQSATLILSVVGMLISCGLFICNTNKLSSIKEAIRKFSITDYAFLFMLVSHIVTTLLSQYSYESWSGSSGRQMGLLFTFLITSMYFLVSRWYRQEMSIIFVYLGSVALVTILGLCNFYGFDFFHFSDLLSQFDTQRYLSTIGNITFFAHLMCLSLPISCILFTHAKHKNSQLIYACFVACGFAGIYIANLDGGYLGMAAFLAFLLYYCLFSYQRFRKFLLLMIIALSTGKLLFVISSLSPEFGRGFVTISYWIVSSNLSSIILCLFTALYAVCVKYERTFEKFNYARIRTLYVILLSLAVLSVLALLGYFTFINPDADIGIASNYLRYSDAWGTGRGVTWNRSLYLYFNTFSIQEKIFGGGLDTLRIFLVNNFTASDITAYDNAHNEYIQYLVTSGISGLLTYLVLFISIQIRLYIYGKQNPWMIAILGCLIAHGAQAITGLNQPITTPILFILIAIGESYIRSHKKEEQDMKIESVIEREN